MYERIRKHIIVEKTPIAIQNLWESKDDEGDKCEGPDEKIYSSLKKG